jgi:hypothetical protein
MAPRKNFGNVNEDKFQNLCVPSMPPYMSTEFALHCSSSRASAVALITVLWMTSFYNGKQ